MPSNEAKLHDFEGGQYTAAQVQKMMPIYSIKAIRSYLAAGAKTKAEVHAIAHQRQVNSKAQAKKNATAGGLNNSAFFIKRGKTNA